MEKFILEVAQRHNIESIVNRISNLQNKPTIKIGFIGEFSTGKSSLINSMLGIKLPTNIRSTTKSICIIEPTVDQDSNEYFVETTNGERRAADYLEFSDIVSGQIDGIAGVKVRECDVLPRGCVFVDTPGVHSASGSEAALTYSYLLEMDAAIFCINITDGTLNKTALDFLCTDAMKHIQKHIVFALTHSDLKTESEITNIKASIVKQLESLRDESKLNIDAPENRVFAISANSTNNAEVVYDYIENAILGNLSTIYREKEEQSSALIKEDLKSILKDKVKSLSYNNDELDFEIKNNQEDLKNLEVEIRRRTSTIGEFERKLARKIESNIMRNLDALITSPDESTQVAGFEILNEDLQRLIMRECASFSSSFEFDPTVLGNLYAKISNTVQLAYKTPNKMANIAGTLSIIFGSAIAAGAVAGGLTASGGATLGSIFASAKAGLPAVAKNLATSKNLHQVALNSLSAASKEIERANESLVKESAKESVKESVKESAKESVNESENANLSKVELAKQQIQKNGQISACLEFVSGIVSLPSDLFKFGTDKIAKNNAMEMCVPVVESFAASIAQSVLLGLDQPYQEEVIQPLKAQLLEKSRYLDSLQKNFHKELDNLKATRLQLQEDIKLLS